MIKTQSFHPFVLCALLSVAQFSALEARAENGVKTWNSTLSRNSSSSASSGTAGVARQSVGRIRQSHQLPTSQAVGPESKNDSKEKPAFVMPKDVISEADMYKLSDQEIDRRLRTAKVDKSGWFYEDAYGNKYTVEAYEAWARHVGMLKNFGGSGPGSVITPAQGASSERERELGAAKYWQQHSGSPTYTRTSTVYEAPSDIDRKLRKEIFNLELNYGPESKEALTYVLKSANYYYTKHDFTRARKLYEKLLKHRESAKAKAIIPFDKVEAYYRATEKELSNRSQGAGTQSDTNPGSLENLGSKFRQY